MWWLQIFVVLQGFCDSQLVFCDFKKSNPDPLLILEAAHKNCNWLTIYESYENFVPLEIYKYKVYLVRDCYI